MEKLEERIKRFVICNSRMRETTLESEREFLKLAGNISAAQLQILLTIGENESCRMSQLAKTMHFSKANITQMVDRMVQKRFVKKVKRRNDQRVIDVILLEKGKKIVNLNKEHVMRVAKSWFSKMTEQEQEAMLSMWERYLNA